MALKTYWKMGRGRQEIQRVIIYLYFVFSKIYTFRRPKENVF